MAEAFWLAEEENGSLYLSSIARTEEIKAKRRKIGALQRACRRPEIWLAVNTACSEDCCKKGLLTSRGAVILAHGGDLFFWS